MLSYIFRNVKESHWKLKWMSKISQYTHVNNKKTIKIIMGLCHCLMGLKRRAYRPTIIIDVIKMYRQLSESNG